MPSQEQLNMLRPPAPPYVIERPNGHLRPSPDDEWILTIGNGGFAMGTAGGLNRRKYHALLIASLRPPVERYSCLAGLDETIIVEPAPGRPQQRLALSAYRFTSGYTDYSAPEHVDRFEKEPLAARWVYQALGLTITKELTLAWGRNACAVRYEVRGLRGQTVRLFIQPRVTMRDFHALNTSLDPDAYHVTSQGPTLRVARDGRTLAIRCDHASTVVRPHFLEGVHLDFESERHQEDVEHVFTPGAFEVAPPESEPGQRGFTIVAALAPDEPDLHLFTDARALHRARIADRFAGESGPRRSLVPLVDAADDFLVRRRVGEKELTTVLAGFPWFSDWGRDTMISLFGLMLVTRRYDDARGALETFAAYRKNGLIPNLFDDYGGPPQYNTVDASLWFLHACVQYLRAANDRDTFDRLLLPACREIIEHTMKGTDFSIRMDPADALIQSGDHTTQLTWMDAKRDGVVFTPRHGKPVEINALWHHGLLSIASAVESSDPAYTSMLRGLASRVAESFRASFWDPARACLHDCLQQDDRGRWQPLPQFRPNQIFAASLEHTPLDAAQKRAVVRAVRDRLLTPMGLRTLDPADPGYRPRFEGDMMSRDRAYHNGTVWPWLIGPYCEALLRAENFSSEARAEARAALQPLLDSMKRACLGQIAEIYDAEAPRRAQGCVAQAWSVAEVLRAACLTIDDHTR